MKAYISCPLSEDKEKLNQVIEQVKKDGFQPVWYVRGTQYISSIVDDCPVFILVVRSFNTNVSGLSPGCYKELRDAWEKKRTIYIAYTKADGKVGIYDTSLQYMPDTLHGVSGSSKRSKPKGEIVTNYEIY